MSDPTEPVPGSGPQYGAPPPYQQGYGPPARGPALTLGLIATIVIIGGYVAAGAGVLAALVSLTIDDVDGAYKFQQFLNSLSLGVGLGAIAVGVGNILKTRSPG